jgi:G:T-mismatch repair DNA endonuclease (very short patch repair protein)
MINMTPETHPRLLESKKIAVFINGRFWITRKVENELISPQIKEKLILEQVTKIALAKFGARTSEKGYRVRAFDGENAR